MLPKVRRGEAEYSKIEEILNDFKKEDGYSDKIKEFFKFEARDCLF